MKPLLALMLALTLSSCGEQDAKPHPALYDYFDSEVAVINETRSYDTQTLVDIVYDMWDIATTCYAVDMEPDGLVVLVTERGSKALYYSPDYIETFAHDLSNVSGDSVTVTTMKFYILDRLRMFTEETTEYNIPACYSLNRPELLP